MAAVFAFGDEFIRVPYLDTTDICLKCWHEQRATVYFHSDRISSFQFFSVFLRFIWWGLMLKLGGQKQKGLEYDGKKEERANGWITCLWKKEDGASHTRTQKEPYFKNNCSAWLICNPCMECTAPCLVWYTTIVAQTKGSFTLPLTCL
jgi:hypothetical protein